MRYIETRKKPAAGNPFPALLEAHDDATSLIVHRGSLCFVILNNFPYNPGHLMVLPQREVADLGDLTAAERVEFFDLIIRCQAVLRQTLQPSGFNVGMNLGKVAGAGIPQHLHAHIVPRWDGDHNFMPVIADTHILPQALSELWEKIATAFRN